MTDTAWHGVSARGTVRAGELISALKKVSPARSRHEGSPLSGTTLYVVSGTLTVWATNGVMVAVTPVELQQAGREEQWLAVVPSGYHTALRERFERSDVIELGLRGSETLLARRPGESAVLAQALWMPHEQVDAYGAVYVGEAAEGVASVRGKDLVSRLRGVRARASVTLALERQQLTLLSGGAAVGDALPIASSLPPQSIELDLDLIAGAVDAVTNLKLPNVMFETHDDGRVLKLYGASRSEPVEYGALDCFIVTGPRLAAADAPPTSQTAVPGDAVVEEPKEAAPVDEILAELDGIIGQPALKKQVRALKNQVAINRKRAEQGLKAGQVGSHMVFAGPPGTGKTTVARLIAKLYHALGVLENEDVVEVSRAEIVSENIGGTEKNMREAVEKAQGGVLFVDEAYAFAAEKGSNDFGQKAIEVLLKAVEDNRDSFVCILAGYTDRMKDFMASNPGLRSRFPRQIDFEQYAAEELVQIARSMAKGTDNDIDEGGVAELVRRLADERRRGGFDRKDWGNARSIRNIVEQAAMHRDMRISLSGEQDRDSLVNLTAADIADACDDFRIGRAAGRTETVEQVLAELDGQVGQPQLKQQIRAIVAQAKVQQAKHEHGMTDRGMELEHLLFVGPPGTGKTSVARLVARLYRALGVLPNEELVEVDQQSLVAGYIGQTAIKTKEKIDEAMGGVLFIDEAYSLVNGTDHSSFGQEAIDTLLKPLVDDRGKFVAIAAGYPDEMEKFLAANVGLSSRFTTRIEFLPYTADELVQIAQSMAAAKAEALDEGAAEVLGVRLVAMERSGAFATKSWGNARAVQNVLARAMQLRDLRISEGDLSADRASLVTITEADMAAACDRDGIASGARAPSEG